MEHVAIIGNGIAGITAARHLRKKSDCRITVISAETDHFYSRTALMYIYMGDMKYKNTKPYEDWFWEKNRIDLKRGYVEKVDFDGKQLHFSTGESLGYDKLILATGSTPNKFGWPGQDLDGVQGLFSYQDLELMEKNTAGIESAVVIGGGLIGIEMVEMLLSRGIKVHFLVRELKFWGKVLPREEARLIEKHMRDHHVDLWLGEELDQVLGNADGRVKGIVTKNGEEIDCQFVGLTVGVHANIEFLKGTALKLNRGIVVNEFLETNMPDVYAIGDCAEFDPPLEGRPPMEQIWYTGRMMGETVAHTITKKRTAYKPHNFFNSAKLFDVEYQIYSRTMILPTDLEQLLWIAPDGLKAIRLFYEIESREIVAFSLLGVRYRHEVCDRWITQKKDIEYVLTHLADANFDPEFYPQHEQELVDLYNQRNDKQLTLKKKSWANIFRV